MADIEAALPALALPPPPERAGATVAATTTRRGLLALAADTAAYGFTAAAWLVGAAVGASIAARRAFGEGSPAVAAAWKLFCAAVMAMALLALVGAPLLAAPRAGAQPPPTRPVRVVISMVEAPRPNGGDSTGGRRRQDGGYGPATVVIIVSIGMLMIVGTLLAHFAPEKGSCQERIGSMLADIRALGNSVMLCFVFVPNMVIYLRDKQW